jgi:hypothetical protein
MVPVPQRASPAPPPPTLRSQVAPDRLPHAAPWGPRVKTPGIASAVRQSVVVVCVSLARMDPDRRGPEPWSDIPIVIPR